MFEQSAVILINKASFLDVYRDINTGKYVIKSSIRPFGFLRYTPLLTLLTIKLTLRRIFEQKYIIAAPMNIDRRYFNSASIF